MRKFLVLILILITSPACAVTQTINTLPSANSTFIADNQSFLEDENSNRDSLRGGNYIISGGIGATSVNLTHTISELIAFPNGFYVNQGATSRTYTPSTRTFVYVRDSDTRTITIVGASITYDSYLVFAEMAPGSDAPTLQTGTLALMRVDSNGTTITAVRDLRDFTGENFVRLASGTDCNFHTAITNAGTDITTYYVDSACTLTANVVAPDTATIYKTRAGSFTGAFDLTINGNIQGNMFSQWFDNATTVVFGEGAIETYYPQMFGASGDGTNAATTIEAINKTITTANASGGGTVSLVGTFLINSPILLLAGVHLDMDKNSRQGWVSLASNILQMPTVKLADASNTGMLLIDGGDLTGVHNIRFDGNGPNQTSYDSYGIKRTKNTYATDITGCSVINTLGWSYWDLGGGTATVSNNTFQNGAFLDHVADVNFTSNNVMGTNGTWPAMWLSDFTVKNVIANNFMWGGPDNASILSTAFPNTAINVATDIITVTAGHGIPDGFPVIITSSDGAAGLPEPIQSNAVITYFVTNVSATEIKLSPQREGGYESAVYVNFTTQGSGTITAGVGTNAVLLVHGRWCEHNMIIGNRIEDGRVNATEFRGARKNTFTGNYSGKSNTSDYSTGSGLLIDVSSFQNTITGNILGKDADGGASFKMKYGVYIDDTSYRNVLTGNIATGNETKDYYDGYATYSSRNVIDYNTLANGTVTNSFNSGVSLLPAFTAFASVTQSDIAKEGNIEIVFGGEAFDTTSSFASNIFTAPVAGIYEFSTTLKFGDIDSAASYYNIFIDTSGGAYRHYFNPTGFPSDVDDQSISFSCTVELALAETAKVQVFQSGGTAQTDIIGNATVMFSYFSGKLLQ